MEITNPRIPLTRLPGAFQEKVGKFIDLVSDPKTQRKSDEILRQVVISLNQDQLKLVSNWVGQLISSPPAVTDLNNQSNQS